MTQTTGTATGMDRAAEEALVRDGFWRKLPQLHPTYLNSRLAGHIFSDQSDLSWDSLVPLLTIRASA